MADTWQLCGDDARERATFGTLAATLAVPAVPAAPANRLRHVRRLDTAHGRYFLKTFTRTQWQNRLRFVLPAPRAADDADRERRVAAALRAAGFAAPREVAYGRRGAAAFLLLAALPGDALRDRLLAGGDPALLAAAARHAGRLLAQGFWLPDLSAEHVFVHGDVFAVLDLHNGRLAAAGPAPRWLLRRVLRRSRRSLRDLGLPRELVLRAAVRFLRAAGGPSVRTLLQQEPPWATAARYDAPGKSRAYAERNPARAARELALLRRVWPGRPGETVLDLPCGAGRLVPLLRDTLGHRVVHADGAVAMLREARARHRPTAPSACADALAMPFATGAVDGVVVFRFLHHLPREQMLQVVDEACRVARRFVVLSFFHPCSVHGFLRTLRQLAGAAPTRFPVTLATLRARARRHGFALVQHTAELPYGKDLWLAAFVRDGALAPGTAAAYETRP